ncbi:DUF2922 domain-containing protein [Enterococcus sp. HY326]|uniref:DUF2922 domain-containing protein n=1 Tax=Enterococcus sp. HY326 TaxID=2971265 RepID=UPI00223F5A17|nr:DUF2922 domain-containing protein [Enterococcus sp. HY326]
MRKLHLLFKNADGSRKRIIVECCHQNLSAEAVRKAMEEIIALKLFERNGVQLYTEIVGAKYVEKRITVIFDDGNSRPPKEKTAVAQTEQLVKDQLQTEVARRPVGESPKKQTEFYSKFIQRNKEAKSLSKSLLQRFLSSLKGTVNHVSTKKLRQLKLRNFHSFSPQSADYLLKFLGFLTTSIKVPSRYSIKATTWSSNSISSGSPAY